MFKKILADPLEINIDTTPIDEDDLARRIRELKPNITKERLEKILEDNRNTEVNIGSMLVLMPKELRKTKFLDLIHRVDEEGEVWHTFKVNGKGPYRISISNLGVK